MKQAVRIACGQAYLTLSPDPDVADDVGVRLGADWLLHRHVGQRVLAEYRLGVQVGRQEPTLPVEGLQDRKCLCEYTSIVCLWMQKWLVTQLHTQ